MTSFGMDGVLRYIQRNGKNVSEKKGDVKMLELLGACFIVTMGVYYGRRKANRE